MYKNGKRMNEQTLWQMIEQEYSTVINIFAQHLNFDKGSLLEKMLQITIPNSGENCYKPDPPRIYLRSCVTMGVPRHELIHVLAQHKINGSAETIIQSDIPLAYAVSGYFRAKDRYAVATANDGEFLKFEEISRICSYYKQRNFSICSLFEDLLSPSVGQRMGNYAYALEKKLNKKFSGLNFLYFLSQGLSRKKAEIRSLQ